MSRMKFVWEQQTTELHALLWTYPYSTSVVLLMPFFPTLGSMLSLVMRCTFPSLRTHILGRTWSRLKTHNLVVYPEQPRLSTFRLIYMFDGTTRIHYKALHCLDQMNNATTNKGVCKDEDDNSNQKCLAAPRNDTFRGESTKNCLNDFSFNLLGGSWCIPIWYLQ